MRKQKIKKYFWICRESSVDFFLLRKNTIGAPEVTIMQRSWLEVLVELIVFLENYFNVNEVRATACNAVKIHSLARTTSNCLWHTLKIKVCHQ